MRYFGSFIWKSNLTIYIDLLHLYLYSKKKRKSRMPSLLLSAVVYLVWTCLTFHNPWLQRDIIFGKRVRRDLTYHWPPFMRIYYLLVEFSTDLITYSLLLSQLVRHLVIYKPMWYTNRSCPTWWIQFTPLIYRSTHFTDLY